MIRVLFNSALRPRDKLFPPLAWDQKLLLLLGKGQRLFFSLRLPDLP